MNTRKGFFWRVKPLWAIIEGWMIGGFILALIALVMREASTYTTGQGILLAAILAAGWSGLRTCFRPGGRLASLLEDAAAGILLGIGMMLIEAGLVAVFNIQDELQALNVGEFGVYLSLASTAVMYWGARTASFLLSRWLSLVRNRFQWNLVNIILVMVGVLVVAGVLTVSIISRGEAIKPEVIEDVSPLVPLLDILVRTVFPYAAISLGVALAAMLVILPLAFLLGYLVSRRLTLRLDGLVHAARRLREGDWSARVEKSGEDELAQLQDDFNAMASELQRTNSDLQASRDQVAGLLQAQRELTAAVSHELRTPVATLRGYVENDLSQGQLSLPDVYLRDLEIMQHEVLLLQGLIDDLFTLSRVEVGQLSMRIDNLDVTLLLHNVVEAARPSAWRSGKIEVTADTPENSIIVAADPGRLEQALRNLIDNAVRYTPPGGIVIVRACANAGEVEITVADTGPGIPAEDLPHIWERFYRASDGSGGTGLGLALVKELVEAMGGSVWVESKCGQGSRFSIRLKAA